MSCHVQDFTVLGLLLAMLGTGALSGARTWTHIFAVSVDILFFSICRGVYDCTISSWCGLQMRRGKANCNRFAWCLGSVLNTIQKDHCELAIAADQARAAAALNFLTGGPYRP